MTQEIQLSTLIEDEPIGRLRTTLIAPIAATIIIDGAVNLTATRL